MIVPEDRPRAAAIGRILKGEAIVDLNPVVADDLNSSESESLQALHRQVALRVDLAIDLLPIHGSPVHLSNPS